MRSGTAFVFAVAMSWMLPVTAQAADASGCSLKRAASIDMLPEAQGLALVQVDINGTKFPLIVDTGGILSSLSQEAVHKLNLSPRLGDEAEIQVNGKKMTGTVNVASFGIGDMHGSNFEFVVDPNAFLGSVASGRLSPDLLRGFDVDFDFAANKFNLFSPDHCEGKVVYWTTNYTQMPITLDRMGHIVTRIELDGVTLDAVIDTGSARSTISEEIANRAYHINENTPGIEHIPDAQPDDVLQYRYRFKTLSMNGITVKSPIMVILPDLAEQQMKTDLGKLASDPQYGMSAPPPRVIIGMDVLRQLHIYIAYKESMIYASPASAH